MFEEKLLYKLFYTNEIIYISLSLHNLKINIQMKYKRILLKLSGEALMGSRQYGIDNDRLKEYAEEIKKVVDLGCEVAIVIGGGNIFRGLAGAANGMDRVQGDYMGMLATVINGMALQGALENLGIHTRLQSAIEMDKVAEPFIKRRATRHLEKGRVVIFWSRNGQSLFHYRYCCYT